MKKVEIQKFGPPPIAAKCVNVAGPNPPSPWEATVKVMAFPINPADLAMISGNYGTLPTLPSGIGMEAAGFVTDVGSKVEGLSIGDSVVCIGNNNWAQFTNLPATTIHKIPNQTDLIQASMMKVNPSTAKLLLDQVNQAGKSQWVAQNAPLGGVGRSVIQIAKKLGLKTINIVRRSSAIEEVKDLGGDIVLVSSDSLKDDLQELIGHQSPKFGFDAVGGQETGRLTRILGNGGTVFNYGMLSGESCQVDPNECIFRQISLQGFWLSKKLNLMTHNQRSEMFQWLAGLIANEDLVFPVDSTYQISQISEAIIRCENPDRCGKVIVLPNGEFRGKE